MHMADYGVGILVGVMVALIGWLIYAKKTGALKQKNAYDERQIAVQGKAYKIAYSITLIGLFILSSLAVFIEPLSVLFLSLGAITLLCVSLTFFAVYCISQGAFIGLQQRWKSYIVMYIAVVLCNLSSFLINLSNMREGILVDIYMTRYTLGINVLIMATFSVVLVALLIARVHEGRGGADEES